MSRIENLDWKWMEWMGKGEEVGEAEVGKKGKDLVKTLNM